MSRRYDIYAIILLAVLVIAYASLRTEFHLQNDMPADFVKISEVPKQKRAREEQIARAYWKCAVEELQWKYGYAHRLPEEAPPEFKLAAEFGPEAADGATRERYWRRLRELWDISTVWKKEYVFDLPSVRRSVQSGGDWLERLVRRVTGNP